MSLFMFLEADALDKRFQARGQQIRIRKGADPDSISNEVTRNRQPVRRPYRGIQIKDDTYATLSVLSSNGSTIPLVSSSAFDGEQGSVKDYSDFILNSVTDERSEKQQIVETFGDSFIFFFGERPRVVTFTGVLINTEDFNWRSQFWYNYDNHLRGTKLVQKAARAFLSYDSVVVSGYPISARATDDSNRPYEIPFSLTMFVTNYEDYSSIGSTSFPTNGGLPDLDLLNRELEERHGQFVNSTAQVRQKAVDVLTSAGSGFRGFMIDALKKADRVSNLVEGSFDTLTNLLAGRVVRVPLGIAGAVASAGDAQVAAGSLTEETLRQLKAIGSVNLRVIGAGKFTPINERTFRTRFSANWDEYPLRDAQPDIPLSFQKTLAFNRAVNTAYGKGKDAALLAVAASAAVESTILTTMADIVKFTKKGFALAANVEAAIEDPGPVLLGQLGLSGISSITPG
jgi:hypothetical protein